jgi:hypothetical protein
MQNKLTQEKLKKQLHYNLTTGLFTRKVSNSNSVKIGDIAGSVHSDTGYLRIWINGKSYFAHRLAYLYMEGSFPPEQTDHRNHNRLDNRWVNLRLTSHQENQKNRSISANNKSGFNGVSWHKDRNKWVANIRINGKQKNLGYFKELAEAIDARQEANIKYGYHQNHGAA